MAKRNKQAEKIAPESKNAGSAAAIANSSQAPARQPTLLAVSLVLFALWFVFLLVTALTG
jgi:hypothetical protein